jgi:Zinc finger, C2H2 type
MSQSVSGQSGKFQCTHCNKACSYNSKKRHIQTHTTNKRHSCPISGCNKDFARSDGLNRHLKTHVVSTMSTLPPIEVRSNDNPLYLLVEAANLEPPFQRYTPSRYTGEPYADWRCCKVRLALSLSTDTDFLSLVRSI